MRPGESSNQLLRAEVVEEDVAFIVRHSGRSAVVRDADLGVGGEREDETSFVSSTPPDKVTVHLSPLASGDLGSSIPACDVLPNGSGTNFRS
jgi:hypothetical protein